MNNFHKLKSYFSDKSLHLKKFSRKKVEFNYTFACFFIYNITFKKDIQSLLVSKISAKLTN